MNVLVEGIRSYVFKQAIRRVSLLNPDIETNNKMIMRRVDDSRYRTIDNDNYRFKTIDL